MALRLCVFVVLGGLAVSQLGTAAPSRPVSGRLPAPAFRPSPEWVTVTTGPTDPEIVPPQVWAITLRGNVSALRPFDLYNGMRALSRDAILIWVSTRGRGGPTKQFKRAQWPLRLSTFRVSATWEGQPKANVQERARLASVNGWRLDVRVYFGTQRPGTQRLRETREQLGRLLLPR